MARSKIKVSKDPDFLPDLLQRWLDSRTASVVVVEKSNEDRVTLVTWFTSDGHYRSFRNLPNTGAAWGSLLAWDAMQLEEQSIIKKTFPTWYAQCLRSPLMEVLESLGVEAAEGRTWGDEQRTEDSGGQGTFGMDEEDGGED